MFLVMIDGNNGQKMVKINLEYFKIFNLIGKYFYYKRFMVLILVLK